MFLCVSDGLVRVFRWEGAEGAVAALHAIPAHQYPALACDLGAGGALLLTAGLDSSAALWDVQVIMPRVPMIFVPIVLIPLYLKFEDLQRCICSG